MFGKVIDARAGDRWIKDRYGDIWQKRDNLVRWVLRDIHNKDAVSRWVSDDGSVNGTLIPTPEAHAQLREWGYEVRGEDVPTGRLAAPITEPPLTESRVREIVEEVLAAKQNLYSQIREWGKVEVKTDPRAASPAPAPAPDDWRARCVVMENALQEIKEYWNGSCNERAMRDACEHNVRIAESALAAAPPPPDVSPEPDWRGLLAEVVKAWDATYPLEAKLPESVLPFVNSPALSSARTNLAAKGGK